MQLCYVRKMPIIKNSSGLSIDTPNGVLQNLGFTNIRSTLTHVDVILTSHVWNSERSRNVVTDFIRVMITASAGS